jgi:hypothetical protein
MGILAVYDTVGIQNYIFASNKLAENVGGSKLVADIFKKLLPEVISEETKSPASDWTKGGALNLNLQAEIIYQGGGNAFVAFSDDTIFQAVTKSFLTRIIKHSPGVGVAVAAIETDFGDTYITDFENLNKRLSIIKGGFNIPAFAGNQPITKQSGRTGLPVTGFYLGEYLSDSQMKKRQRYEEYKKARNSKIADFANLAFEKGSDSLIAIVHADGNNMGSQIKALMNSFKTYAEAVPAIRKLSMRIDNCYKMAREKTISNFDKEYQNYINEQSKQFPNKNFSSEPPILELIGDGDDTTLVIGGRFALDFAAKLLREIEATPEEERPFADIPTAAKEKLSVDSIPTACAGIVLFHSHYPFSEAYKLSEELCSNAKKPSREHNGSYIDFHLHKSGNVAGLQGLRERQYLVEGKSLFARPWLVSGGNPTTAPSFRWFEENVQVFKDRNKIPRNKTKALRNAIGTGATAAINAINQIGDGVLPKLPETEVAQNTSPYAPYFDILEVYDAYENLLN